MLAVALAIALSGSADAAPHRAVPANFFAVNWDAGIAFDAPPPVQEAQFGRMAGAGVESVRLSFIWATAQPLPGGPIDFSATDRSVALAAAHGLSVMPCVIDAPPWARVFSDSDFSPPSSPSDYAAYLTALVGRYGPRGSFWAEHPTLPRLPIRAWQVWNEPHMGYQWSTQATGEDWAVRYTLFLRTAYAAIKAADAGAQVVLAGLANDSPSFLSHLYHYGARGYFDVAAIHPYTATAAGVLTLARLARAVMRRYGDAAKQLWITELGLPASLGRSTSTQDIQTTDAGMARFVTDVYREFVPALRAPDVSVSRLYWYTWASSYAPDSGIQIFNFSGLFRWTGGANLTPTPAYSAFVRSARRYEGCAKTAAGRCR